MKNPAVGIIKAQMIDLQPGESLPGYFQRNRALCSHLSKVANTTQQAVSDTGGAATSQGYLVRALRLSGHIENLRGTSDDLLHGVQTVEIESEGVAEAVS